MDALSSMGYMPSFLIFSIIRHFTAVGLTEVFLPCRIERLQVLEVLPISVVVEPNVEKSWPLRNLKQSLSLRGFVLFQQTQVESLERC